MPRPIRVRHVITTLDVGGAENHLLTLLAGFDRGRFRMRVAFLKGAGGLAERFRAIGVEVDRWPLAGPIDPAALARMAWRFRSERPDVVHTHLFKGDFYGGLAAWLAGVRAIVSSKHNEDPELRHPVFGPLGRLVLAADDAVIAISRAVARYLAGSGRVDRRKLRVVHYGVDLPGRLPERGRFRSELGVPAGAPLVVLIGRLEPQKDIGTFLEAAAIVRHDRPDVHFAVVGKGSQEAALRERSRSLGLDGVVRFAGFRTDVPQILSDADALALTSRWEGFGLVLVEAMAAERPVVATATGPVPEVVGDAGLLVHPGDAPGVARALGAVLGDPALAARLGQAGRARVEARFAVRRMVDETAGLYEELLARRRSRW